jgi:hypothetical protein
VRGQIRLHRAHLGSEAPELGRRRLERSIGGNHEIESVARALARELETYPGGRA